MEHCRNKEVPPQWKLRVLGIKNPAQGFHSIINNRVFYRCDVAVSDYINITNKITKITDVAVVLRYRCGGVAF